MKNPVSPRDRKNSEPQSTNQGEGDQAAAKRFNQKEQAFVQSERGRQAIKAGVAVDNSEQAELDDAEQQGRARAKGEDPAVTRNDQAHRQHLTK